MANLTGLVVALAIVFGGGTRQGFFGDTLIQLAAVPLLIAGLWTLFNAEEKVAGALRSALLIIALFFGFGLFQVLPLPEALRLSLAEFPARVPGGFPDLGAGLSTVSISPQATWAALISVVPPVAIFIAVAQLPNAARRRVAFIIVSLGVISLVLGLLQVAHGPRGPLRFYSITNPAEAVGFFANRNHFAALLYTTILVAAPFVVAASRGLVEQTQPGDKSVLRFLWAFLLMAALMIGLIMARSRTGIVFGVVALATVALLSVSNAWRQGVSRAPAGRPKMMVRLIAALVAVTLVAGTVLALQRAAPRFGLSVADDVRIPILLATLDAARAYLPFGSGLGTFVPAYAALEPTDAIFSAFANRAHNDWAEFALEYGVAGIAILLAVLIWIARRGIEIWRGQWSRCIGCNQNARSSQLGCDRAGVAACAGRIRPAHQCAWRSLCLLLRDHRGARGSRQRACPEAQPRRPDAIVIPGPLRPTPPRGPHGRKRLILKPRKRDGVIQRTGRMNGVMMATRNGDYERKILIETVRHLRGGLLVLSGLFWGSFAFAGLARNLRRADAHLTYVG